MHHPAPLPLVKDLVLIGGGHAHALVLRMWGMRPLPGVRVTVINPGPIAPYTGMLPGLIAGHYDRHEIFIDLIRLARFAGARAVLDRVTGIDRATGHVLLGSGQRIAFDLASIDIGIGSDLPEVPGFADHAVAAKPLGLYADRWRDFCATAPADPHLVIVGGGVGGVELALASAHRLRALGKPARITVLDRAPAALPNIGRAARDRLLAAIQRDGITLLTGTQPARIDATGVALANGQYLRSDFTLSVAGARPQGWLAETGLHLTEGFVTVGPTLQSSDPAIFAAGDAAHLSHAPRPKAGVFAVREAPVLSHNLRALLTGGALRPYRPQRDYLKLVSTGGKSAVADKFGLRSGGAWLWRWKDRIDRRFMAMFADYPAMPAPPLPNPAVLGLAEALGSKPLCGGCGAKVGAGTLRQALASLPAPQHPDVISGPGDDAAILRHGAGFQVMTTDHLRSVTHDPALMARIAAVHALGDIWAMGARPQGALLQVTLPRLAPRLQAETLREVMAGFAAVLTPAGADILGGHSAVGAELTLGLTLTGHADRVLTKGGARPGAALILTKPLGTGTILAAEMAMAQTRAPMLGEAVAACLASMTRPSGDAAAILATEAQAMTDVTGFGLAGHLLEMLDASGVAAVLADLPFLPGAVALARAGHASTLAPANRAATAGRVTAPDGPETDLLYDPQTGGGLLAAVPQQAAAALIARLHDAGHAARIIGQITEGAPAIRVSG
jgi:selenide,water dikinase